MNSFVLHGNGRSDHTLVSNVFLDEYMPAANGEYVKVYLFLLRCLESDTQELSIPLIADRFDHTENDVRRALKYWEKMKLLKLEYDSSKNLTGICLTDGRAEDTVSCTPVVPADAEPAAKPASPEKRGPVKPFTEEEARQLLFICEQYLGKTLSSTEVSKILEFHDTFGFSSDLIEYLIEYCVSKRRKSMRYIESVALGWYEEGITKVSQAKQQVSTYNKAYFSILKAFGITNRNPVDAEISYMDQWMKAYGFSTELIVEACSRTMAAIHQPSFEYADKILRSWKENGVKALSDLAGLDEKYRSSRSKQDPATVPKTTASNRFRNFRERDYNFEELQKQLINH